ncbi:MAG: FHA domain-containing protein [Thermomicrobiales bacterium]
MSAIDSGELLYDLLRFAFAGLLILFLVQMARIMVREIDIGTQDQMPAAQQRPLVASLMVLDAGASSLVNGASLFVDGRATIGRAPECDIVLDDPSVSSVHAALFVESGQWFIEDYDSMNGSWARGRPVEGTVMLKNGDMLQFGRVRARLLC